MNCYVVLGFIIFASLTRAYDTRIKVFIPLEAKTYNIAFPRPDVELEFEDGPVAEAVRRGGLAFDLCLDFDAVRAQAFRDDEGLLLENGVAFGKDSPTVQCVPLSGGGGDFKSKLAPQISGERNYTFVSWLRPHFTEANRVALSGASVKWWASQGAVSRVVSYQVAQDWAVALRVDSPQAGFAYGGAPVPVTLNGNVPRSAIFCVEWDVTTFEESTLDKMGPEAECHGLTPFHDSPSPEASKPGTHLFRVSLYVDGQNEPAVTIKVPYSTYRTLGPLPPPPRAESGLVQTRRYSSLGKHLNDSRVGDLWRELGLTAAAVGLSRAVANPAAHVESLSEDLTLSAEQRAVLWEQLMGPNDFPRALTLFDFAAWAREFNFTRARSALLVDPRDVEVKLLDLELATVAADDDADAGASASGATDCFSGDLCADSEAPSSRSRGVTVYAYDSDSGSGDLHRLLADRNQIAASEGLGGGAAPPLPGEPFELAIVSQTLEHLLNPDRALRGLWHRLAPGGILFASVPALSIPHFEPFHFRSFTPMAGLVLNINSPLHDIYLKTCCFSFHLRAWPSH